MLSHSPEECFDRAKPPPRPRGASPDPVYRLPALAEEGIPRLVVQQRRLPRRRGHRHDAHGRPGGCVADRVCVRSIRLSTHDAVLHVITCLAKPTPDMSWRHDAAVVTACPLCAGPEMRPRTGLHPHEAGITLGTDPRNRAAADPAHHRAARADAVPLKERGLAGSMPMLVGTCIDRCPHGSVTAPHMADRNAGNGGHPSHRWHDTGSRWSAASPGA